MHFDFIQSRIHGMENIDALVAECSKKFPIPSDDPQLSHDNIHYVLDDECLEGMSGSSAWRGNGRPAATAFHPKRCGPLAQESLNLRKKGPPVEREPSI